MSFLRPICTAFAQVMDFLFQFLGSWPLTIFCMALLVRLLIYPATTYGLKAQSNHKTNMAKIKPQLDQAKASLKGRQLHIKTMKIYEKNGVSPMDALKGLLPLMLQIPFFMIMYTVISEEPRLSLAGFLWAKSLAEPDCLTSLPFTIPLLGNSLNLFPIIMGMVTILSSRLQSDDPSERRSLYIMAIAFTLLFYHFPAGLIMYWTLSNLFQLLHQLVRQRSIARPA